MFQTPIGGKFAALNLIDHEIDTIANDIKVGLVQLKRYWEETDGSILQTNRSSNESEDSPPVLEGKENQQ